MDEPTIPVIAASIRTVRGERILLDADLADLYGVTTKQLNQAVVRNHDRFPDDFRFQLNPKEWGDLKSQSVTSNPGSGGRQKLPWAFTEHGALMAANILRSPQAVQMSVFVIRAFIRMRATLSDTAVLAAKLEKLEREVTDRLDSHEKAIVELMRQFLTIINPEETPSGPEPLKREIGFHVINKVNESKAKLKLKRAR